MFDEEHQDPQYQLSELTKEQLIELVLSYQERDKRAFDDNTILTKQMGELQLLLANASDGVANILNLWNSRNIGSDRLQNARIASILAGPGKAN